MRRKRNKQKVGNIISTHVMKHFKEYTLAVLTFVFGIVIGVIIINNSNDEQISQIITYINNFISDLKESGNINTSNLLVETICNNLYLILTMWFVGSTVIGIPVVYALVAYKGFCLSYTIASSVLTLGTLHGTFFSIASMLLQNIIYIPCILALAVSGIRLYKSIMKDKRRENIKIEIIRHTIFSGFIGIFIILGGVIETYISTSLITIFINTI